MEDPQNGIDSIHVSPKKSYQKVSFQTFSGVMGVSDEHDQKEDENFSLSIKEISCSNDLEKNVSMEYL